MRPLPNFKFLFFSLMICCISCQKVPTDTSSLFKELSPLPGSTALWGPCSEIPVRKEDSSIYYRIGAHEYRQEQLLGEGGIGKVYSLSPIEPGGRDLVIKIPKHESDSGWAYNDLLTHSSLEMIGVPTIRAGLGFIKGENNETIYVLVKERIYGRDFEKIAAVASLQSFNVLNPKDRKDSIKKLTTAGKIFSRVINSGIYIVDMHSRNLLWDERKSQLSMVDGSITPASLKEIDPREGFHRAIGWPTGIPFGDSAFYHRYYSKNEKASSEAIQAVRARLEAFFSQAPGSDCQGPALDDPIWNSTRAPYEIDAHRKF